MAAVAGGAVFLMLFGIPRSARWLVTRNRISEAEDELRRGTPEAEGTG